MKRQQTLDRLFDISNIAVLLLFCFICIYPFYYIFIYSISDPLAAQKGIVFLPRQFTLDNYEEIFRLNMIFHTALVSLSRTIIGTVITVWCCAFLGYLVSKQELPYRKIIYRFVVITLYFNAGLIPWYLTMKLFHLNNNFLLYIIPSAISAFYVILIKTFIEQLPAGLEESAKIDGAGYIIIFTKIIFPLSMPIVATIAIFSAVSQWNTWIDNYFLAQSANLKTLQLLLYEYLSQASQLSSLTTQELSRGEGVSTMTPQTIRMTMTMVVTLPIIFVYPFLQKYFVKGLMLGAIKG